uniref:DNA 5'-3' helicase n=1 Tax=Heterorhabditis bacteriophora TaxID=37862 RepID=A0A1I7XS21_HETBA
MDLMENRWAIVVHRIHADSRQFETVKISNPPLTKRGAKSCVVFDEAHNIDNVCIESMSIGISHKQTEKAVQELAKLDEAVQRTKRENADRLQSEYEKLVEGLKRAERERANDERLANPVLPDAILHEAVPGSIRTAQHFVLFMKRVVEYVRHRMRSTQVPLCQRSNNCIYFFHYVI